MRLRTLTRTVLTTIVASTLSSAQPTAVGAQGTRALQSARVNPIYGKLPLTFEANNGQTDPQVKFLSRGRGYTAFLTVGGMVLSLRPAEVVAKQNTAPVSASGPLRSGSRQSTATTLQFRLVGASQNPAVIGEDPQPGRVNYFFGNNPAKWRRNVPTYGRVRYKNVYPGIDLVYYGNHRQLEYDFAVAPGADPTQIQFEIKGANQIQVDAEGNLQLETNSGKLRFQSPLVYQESGGQRLPVSGGHALQDSTHVSFHVSAYDRAKSLVIDPAMVYSSYLGGSGTDQPAGIAVDSAGSVYVAGYTDSADFPLATLGSLPAGANHVFVAKFDTTGSNLVYADYIGGNGQDYGYALVLDSSNNVYVTGSTASSDFPMVRAYQPVYPGSFNAFLSKISADGSSLLYASYLGGNGSDQPSSLALDAASEVLVAGNTTSTNFPVVNAYQATASPNQGGVYGNYGFLSKFSADGSSLVYSTYLSGDSNVVLNCGGVPCWPSPYSAIAGVAIDANGDAYAAGITNTYNFPVTPGAYLTTDSTQQNGMVGFVSKISGSGSLQYSTYFYESSGLLTDVNAIAVDDSGSAYVTGVAYSDGTFPITSTSICDPVVQGWACSFAFATKFDSTGSALAYSTFLGANNWASPVAIVLDANRDAYVLASTSSNSFGTVNGIEPYTSGSDILLAEVDPTGSTELFATYLGANGNERPGGLALDASGDVYVAGSTDSTDFPVAQAAFQDVLGGNSDGFVLKIGPSAAPAVSLSPWQLQYSDQQVGSTSPAQSVLLRNMGSTPLAISSITAIGDFAETDSCGGGVPAAASCTFTVSFTPTAAGLRSGSIRIQDDAGGSPHIINLSGRGTGPVVSLNPTSLTFAGLPVGTSSAAQTVTLTNSGDAALNIGGIQVSGEYAHTNNCPLSLLSGSSCKINVMFTPTSSGSRNGTLTISDDAQGSPHNVGLAGTGLDFILASPASSATVKAGSTASYTLNVASVGGSFNNPVKLSCSGAPAQATCSLSQRTVTPGATPATVTVTIHTTGSVAQAIPASQSRERPVYAVWIQLQGMGWLAMIVAGFKRRARKLRAFLLLALMIAGLMLMIGCAGGTGIAQQPPPGTPPGTYTITITGTSGTLRRSLPLTLTVQ